MVRSFSTAPSRLVDVGHDQLPPGLRTVAGHGIADMAEALDGNGAARQRIGAGGMLQRRLDADKDAECGIGRGVAQPSRSGSESMPGAPGDDFHVIRGDANVLGRNITAAESLDLAAERLQQRCGLVFPGIAEDHRLAAAKRQAGKGVLVGHAFRQPQHVGKRLVRVGIVPHPATAERRTEARVVDRDDAEEAAGRIMTEYHVLVAGKLRVVEYGSAGRRAVVLESIADWFVNPL